MQPVIFTLLILSFVGGVVGLALLVWAMARGHLRWDQNGARAIFAAGEEGLIEAPAGADETPAAVLADRRAADQSSAGPVRAFLASGIVWLIIGSVMGLIVSLKATWPDLLSEQAWLTFGRLRPLHLTLVIYGWVSMAGIAVALWLLPRLLRTPLKGGRYATVGAWIWNLGVLSGALAILAGWTDGVEWLEIPWQLDIFFVIGGGLPGVTLYRTLRARRVDHLYVSVWYIAAAFAWFPLLFVVANAPRLHFGVEHAIVNWWYAHNVLGLWLTPLGLAAAYYFIPKVLGRPIYSYRLSLVGFWFLALFYSQVGVHHLIGGPVPTWLVTLSIVTSVMMVIPVVAVAINLHLTAFKHLGRLKASPTLRFVVLGAMMYTATSLEGSAQALRSLNRITHFTHFTVGHAHMGVYAFVSMVLFGAVYFLLPRLTGREWRSPRLIRLHFWGAFVGVVIYVVALSVGGWLQGQAMLDAARPFEESVTVTLPWLHLRTVGGALMTASHLIFAWHVFTVLRAPRRQPALAVEA